MDVKYVFYEKLDSIFKFQLTWDTKKPQANEIKE